MAVRGRREGRGHHGGGRQFLFRRRRTRDHRPADEAGYAGAARVHADDGRSRQGDARLRRSRLSPRWMAICAGAGAILALASDIRLGTARSKTAFLFTRVGLAGCDMGACALLPRLIGQGRAAELLYSGRSMSGDRRRALGIFQSAVRARKRCCGKRAHWRGDWRPVRRSPTA